MSERMYEVMSIIDMSEILGEGVSISISWQVEERERQITPSEDDIEGYRREYSEGDGQDLYTPTREEAIAEIQKLFTKSEVESLKKYLAEIEAFATPRHVIEVYSLLPDSEEGMKPILDSFLVPSILNLFARPDYNLPFKVSGNGGVLLDYAAD